MASEPLHPHTKIEGLAGGAVEASGGKKTKQDSVSTEYLEKSKQCQKDIAQGFKFHLQASQKVCYDPVPPPYLDSAR